MKNKQNNDIERLIKSQIKIELEDEKDKQYLLFKTFMDNANSSMDRMTTLLTETRNEVALLNKSRIEQDELLRKEFKDIYKMIGQSSIDWKEAIDNLILKFKESNEDFTKKMEWLGKEYVEFARTHCTPVQMKIIKSMIEERVKEVKTKDKKKQFWKNQVEGTKEILLKEGVSGVYKFIIKILLPLLFYGFLIESKDIVVYIKNFITSLFK